MCFFLQRFSEKPVREFTVPKASAGIVRKLKHILFQGLALAVTRHLLAGVSFWTVTLRGSSLQTVQKHASVGWSWLGRPDMAHGLPHLLGRGLAAAAWPRREWYGCSAYATCVLCCLTELVYK